MSRGLTLMEVLVTVTVVAIVLTATANSFLALYKSNGAGARSIVQVSNGRKGVVLLTQEIRSMSYGENGAGPVASMSPTSLTFYTALPSGGGNVRVQYQLAGGLLTRSATPSGTPPTYSGTPSVSTLSSYVNNIEDGVALFRYYDKNDIEIVDTIRVADVVRVSVTIDIFTVGMSTPFFIFATTTIRNLRAP